MLEGFSRLWATGPYMPHGHCYLWQPALVWLHLGSDLLTAVAYYSIPLSLVYFAVRRQDMPYRGMFWLFGAFIVSCGTTHVLEAWTLWHPVYWLSGTVKAITAVVSLLTAIALIALLPEALKLPSPAQLEAVNQTLTDEILERQQAQAHLQAQTIVLQEQAHLLDLAHDTIMVRDLQSHITFWNQGAVSMYGWSKSQALGRESHQLLQTQFPEPLEALMAKLFQENRWEGELHQVRADGTPLVVDSRWAVQHNEEGEAIAILEINTDITARKQAEALLQQEREFLNTVMEHIDDGVVSCDVQGQLVFCNQRAREFYPKLENATPLSQWITYNGLYRSDGQTPLQSNEMPLYRAWQGETVADEEIVVSYPETEEAESFRRNLLVNGQAIADPEGNPLGAVVSLHDITERKRTEAALRQYAAQLQLMLNFDSMLKRVTDKVRDSLDERQILQAAVQELGEVLGVNRANAALYNLEQQTSTILYEYTTSFFTDQGRTMQMSDYPELYRQLLAGQSFQFCSLDPHPVRGLVAMVACPIVDNQGALGDLWLVNDKEYGFKELELGLLQQVANQCAIAIRQAQLYQAAQAQVKELEKLNRLKDDFMSTVSHELRTPVSNMKMSIRMLEIALHQADMLIPSDEPLDPRQPAHKVAHYLHILQGECDREIALINDLLDLQRLARKAQPLELEPVRLGEWLPQLIEPFRERMQTRQQDFHLDLPDRLPVAVTDLKALGRVMAELINNACKYTPPGHRIQVKTRAALESNQLTLSVLNSGAEIPAQELPRIFDKFYRIPSRDPWKQSGTGLGLALVQSLVEHLSGTIEVRSSAEQTIFVVKLPLSQPLNQGEQRYFPDEARLDIA